MRLLLSGFIAGALLLGALAAAGAFYRLGRTEAPKAQRSVTLSSMAPEAAREAMAENSRKLCPAIWAPVCAADGVVYGNECIAGAEVRYAIPPHIKIKTGEACDPDNAAWIDLPEKPE